MASRKDEYDEQIWAETQELFCAAMRRSWRRYAISTTPIFSQVLPHAGSPTGVRKMQRMLRDYLSRPMNTYRHEVLVKRLFKMAEAANDDDLMAHFLVAFDRSIRRVKRKKYHRESQTVGDVLVVPRNTNMPGTIPQWWVAARAAGNLAADSNPSGTTSAFQRSHEELPASPDLARFPEIGQGASEPVCQGGDRSAETVRRHGH